MVGSSLVDTRSVFRKQQKRKILIFRFCCFGVSGVKPLIKVMASRSEAEGSYVSLHCFSALIGLNG